MTISGLEINPLRIFSDERGSVLHMLRSDDPYFAQFGEIYFSTVNYGAIKGWRRHRRMALNLAVPVGRIRLVVYDDRDDSETRGGLVDLTLGPHDYKLVIVPPGVWAAFQGVAEGISLLANCATIPHRDGEAETRPLGDPPIQITWNLGP